MKTLKELRELVEMAEKAAPDSCFVKSCRGCIRRTRKLSEKQLIALEKIAGFREPSENMFIFHEPKVDSSNW